MTPLLDTARFVLTHPEHYCDRPHLFRHAWLTLKQAHGHPVEETRLGPSRHADHIARVPAPATGLVVDLDSRRARISARIRAHAAHLGLPHRTETGTGTGGDTGGAA